MSSYKILNAQKINSKKLGVVIKPSKNKSKKIDVFKNEKKVATIGDSSYGDYQDNLDLIKKEFDYNLFFYIIDYNS